MKKRGLAAAAIMIAGCVPSFAVYSPADPPVLYAPVSARSTALGNSLFCAESEAARYNPAYLGAVERTALFATYGALQRGSAFGGAYGQFRAGGAAFGLGMTDLRTGGIKNFTGPDAAPAGEIEASQTLVSLAAGMRGSDRNLLLGAALRLLVDTVAKDSSTGYSLDAGAGYLFTPRWRAGLVLSNVLSLYEAEEDIVPQKTTLAVSFAPALRMASQKKDGDNTLFLAASKGTSSNTSFSAGWESVFYGVLAARLGYDRDHPVLGLGLGYPFGNVDIAAAFKGSGPLFFVTLGVTFAPASPAPPAAAAPPAVAPEEKKAKKAKEPAEEKVPAAVPSEAASLAREGWAMLKGNDVRGAVKKFNDALALDPGEPAAAAGMKAAEKEMNRVKKQESLGILLSQAGRALQAGDYAKAEGLYRQTMELDPENGEAREGIRAVIEAVSVEIGESLKKGTTGHFTLEKIPLEEALSISANGSFGSLDACRKYLADEKYGAAWAEWQKVRPRDSGLVRKYDEAFALLPDAVFNAAAARASRKAAGGYYRDAVAELQRSCQADGLPAECSRKAQALISTYEYVGQSVSRLNLAEAEKFIARGQYRPAAACLERAVRSGYDADKARRRLSGIQPNLKKSEAEGAEDKQESGAGAEPPPAAPPEDRETADKPQKPSAPPPLDPRLKESLLNAYMSSAEKLYEQKRYRECRECLLKILYLDPGNQDAKRSLEKVNRLLKQQGNRK